MRHWGSAAGGALAVSLTCAAALASEPLSLDADTPGAFISITGAVSIAGHNPLPVAELPIGGYGLVATGPAGPMVRGRLVRSADGVTSRSWCGPAAFVHPPGLVHLQRGENRGWILLGAGAVSAAMSIDLQTRVQDAADTRTLAATHYAQAVSEDEIARTRGALRSAVREEEDMQEVRNLWLGYLALTWVGASVEAAWLTPRPALAPAGAGRFVLSLPRVGGGPAALRSALLPGAGQRFMGRDGKGNFFCATTAILAAGAIALHDAFLEARRDQMLAQERFAAVQVDEELPAARQELERAADRVDQRSVWRWAAVGAAAGVYIWNVVDAFGGGQPASNPGLAWTAAPSADGLLVCATWSWR